MKKKTIAFLFLFVFLAITILFLIRKNEKKFEEKIHTPLIATAQEDWKHIADLYEKEIIFNPESKRTILQLAIVYDDYLNKKTEAAKYYEKYLEIAPNDEKKSLVKEWLQVAKQSVQDNSGKDKPEEEKTEAGNLLEKEDLKGRAINEKEKEKNNLLNKELNQKLEALKKAEGIIQEKQKKIQEYEKQIKEIKIANSNAESLNKTINEYQQKLKEAEFKIKEYENLAKEKSEKILKSKEEAKALKENNQKLEEELDRQKETFLIKQSRNYRYQEFVKYENENNDLKKKIKIMEAKIIRLYGIIGSLKASNKNLKKTTELKAKNIKKHRVKKGESLRTIATEYYDDKDKWKLIYDINKKKISDPNVLTPGQILEIPEEV